MLEVVLIAQTLFRSQPCLGSQLWNDACPPSSRPYGLREAPPARVAPFGGPAPIQGPSRGRCRYWGSYSDSTVVCD